MTQDSSITPDLPDPGDSGKLGHVSAEVSARPSPSLTGSILRLAAGRGTASLVGLVATPILTRLYEPKIFGMAALVTTLVSMLGPCISFSYLWAMPLAESVAKRRALFVLTIAISLSVTALLTIVAVLGGQKLAVAYGKPELGPYAIIVPLYFCSVALHALTTMTLNCEKKFGSVALREVARKITTATVQIGAALVGFAKSPAGLLSGAIGGLFVGSLLYAVAPVRSLWRSSPQPIRLADVKAVAAQYKRFPLVEFWSQLLISFALGAPILILGLFFPVRIVGLYAIAQRLIELPNNLFSRSSSEVFYVEVGQAVTEGNSTVASATELFRTLVLLMAFPFATALLLGPLLCEVVLGPIWREAGVLVQLLVPWMIVRSLATPLSSILMATNRLGERFAYSLTLLIVRVGVLLIGGLFFDAQTAIGLFVAASVLIQGWVVIRTLYLAKVSRRWAAGMMLIAYSEALLLLLPAAALYWWGGGNLIGNLYALGALAAACFAHLAIIYRRYPSIKNKLLSLLARSTPQSPVE